MNKKLKIFEKIFNRKIFGIFWKNRKNFGQKNFFWTEKISEKIGKTEKISEKIFLTEKIFVFFEKTEKFSVDLWTIYEQKFFRNFWEKPKFFRSGNYEQIMNKKEQMFVFNCEQIVNKIWTNCEQKKEQMFFS